MIGRRAATRVLAGAAAWPLAARAQQGHRVRRIGVFMDLEAGDAEAQSRIAAFLQGLQELGWSVGQNIRIDYRWRTNNNDRRHAYASELVSAAPDVILGSSSLVVAALQAASREVPVVFVSVADPVGAGFVHSLARPGGNATGFSVFEPGISGKWVELLKEIAPDVTRAAVLQDPASQPAQLVGIRSAAAALGMTLSLVNANRAGEIERALPDFGREPNGGLIVTGNPSTGNQRHQIVALADRHRLPSVYPYRHFATAGGLMSYGTDLTDPFRRAAAYVDRILKGATPADLPVQAPIKFELVINLKAAAALGLTTPPSLLARADEVIE